MIIIKLKISEINTEKLVDKHIISLEKGKVL